MRIALISLAAASGAGPSPVIAGRTLARRQLDFALAIKSERIVVMGAGDSPAVIGLRHAAEAAGRSFQAVGTHRALAALARPDDEFLVLDPGVLPEAVEALDLLAHGPAVLVLPAAGGVAAGFERIDLDRAWAGAALVPASLIGRLSDLPDDIEPASALMRAALQARIPEQALPECALSGGRWGKPGPQGVITSEGEWLLRHSPALRALPAPLAGPALVLAARAMARPRAAAGLALGAGWLLLLALASAWTEAASAGFAAIAGAVVLGAGAAELDRMRRAPFGKPPPAVAATRTGLADLALFACACAALDGTWLQWLFPPLVLLLALRLDGAGRVHRWLQNRALLAALFALSAALGILGPVLAAVALGVLALRLLRDRRGMQITTD